MPSEAVMPVFSIVVPVYNAAEYLREALDSILAQTFSGWECVCVDDGSKDGSGMILDEYAAKDVRFRVVRQLNGGVAVARNAALLCAHGGYVCFMDADDTVAPDWLSSYAEVIAEYPVDVIRVQRPWWRVEPGLVSSECLVRWKWQAWVREGYPWTYAIKRDVAMKALFPPGVRMSEDQLYAARLVPYVRSAYQMTRCGYNHRVHAGSAMMSLLPSSERLAYLKAVEALAQSPEVPNQELSRMTSMAIVAWMNRWCDSSFAVEIRQVWKSLKSHGVAHPIGLARLYRFSYAIYFWTGWVTPGRIWAGSIRKVVAFKKWFSLLLGA